MMVLESTIAESNGRRTMLDRLNLGNWNGEMRYLKDPGCTILAPRSL
jgi:hypothetical protein